MNAMVALVVAGLLISALPLVASVVAACMLSSRISQERGE